MAMSPPLTLLLFLMALTVAAASSSAIHISLTHIDSNSNLTHTDLITRAVARANRRLSTVQYRSFSLSTDGNEYYMKIGVGTPPKNFHVVVDTGSDVFWTVGFDPRHSSTYRVIPCKSRRCAPRIPFLRLCDPRGNCTYELHYGDGSGTNGTMALETITLGTARGPVSVPDVAFGRSVSTSGNTLTMLDGIVGFGRGKSSLIWNFQQISQLGVDRFSYCLAPFGSSRLVLGRDDGEAIKQSPSTVTIPLLCKLWWSFYNVDLVGISVDGTALPIPKNAFATNWFVKPGVILDSGTTFTYLIRSAYEPLKRAFVAKVVGFAAVDGAGYGFDVCFKTGEAAGERLRFPGLVFHFRGGIDLELPRENYMIGLVKEGVHCLGIMGIDGISVLGSYFQRDFWVDYDLKNNLVSFTPAKCVHG
ncbi:Aspartic proteinase nepenthesin-2 [Acorus calamus]|uniref:Aspartic proteinase nepenthesin-2 n=1 Tax=Acorus calamus TaxID=4465 RepID=A0AAV9E871_ACOCL|nr:Aspartic proteinase nepenthesin-2 [Acorus calamus]